MSEHLALFYRNTADLLDRVGALLAGAGHRVVALAGPDLAPFAGRGPVRPDPVNNHTRPVAALAAYRRFTGDALVVTQPDPGDSPADWARAARHEAALTFADSPHTVVCAYPAALPRPLREALVETHPTLLTAGGPIANPAHADPAATLSRLAPATPIRPPDAAPRLTAESASVQDLSPLRRRIGEHLADVPTLVRTDFVAAVNEVLTNAYLRGRPPLRLTLWAGADRLECRVTDHGPGLTDPTAGYRPLGSPTRTGAGLWLARQACDDLDMWREPGRFTVRVATARTVRAGGRHAGALARAEIAHARAALFGQRLRP